MFTSNRRQFLKTSLTTSGSMIIALSIPANKKGWKAFAQESSQLTHHYVEITPDNNFFFIMDKAEMGQGVITGQTTLFGEEAEIDPRSFKVKTAPVHEVYATFQGHMVTGGSSSTPGRWEVLRQAGANLKELMLQAAAKKWNSSKDQLKASEGSIINSKGEKLSYGELVSIARSLPFPKNAPMKKSSDFKYIGKMKTSVDALEKSTGTSEYGMDFSIDNMLVAVIERCPTFGGSLKSFDASTAKALPGVKDVFKVPTGVAIVCEKYWQTIKARQAVKIEWDLGDNQKLNSATIKRSYQDKMKTESGNEMQTLGDVETAFSQADQVIEAEYNLPYLAHSTMEPMNATAWVQKGKCDIWSPNQCPSIIRNDAARVLGLDREKVTVHTSKYLGGGFGRRSTLDFSIEAVEVSKKMKAPVKVVWSREDDTQFSPMRPLTVHQFKAAIKNKEVTAWQHKLGCESIMQMVIKGWFGTMMPSWIPDFLGRPLGTVVSEVMSFKGDAPTVAEGAKTPYSFSNKKVDHYDLGIEIPLHFWRSVGHSYNGFVVESFVDELANALKEDPYEFRKKRLDKDSRLAKVLDLVAEKSQWKTPNNKFRGIACHESFNTYVAQVADVEITNGQIEVKKVHCAVDCGVAVNPDNIKKQMESAIIYGLSAALKGQITIEKGGVAQQNFDTYEPLRMSQTPEIIVHIMDSENSPTGVGEPGLPPIGAAVANAVFKATGERLRSQPFNLGQNA